MPTRKRSQAGVGKRSGRRTHAARVKACLGYLRGLGIWAWPQPNRAVYDPAIKRYRKFDGMPGVSDICAVIPGGIFLGVEVKTESDVQTPDQKRFQEEVEKRGGLYILVYEIQDLIDGLKGKL